MSGYKPVRSTSPTKGGSRPSLNDDDGDGDEAYELDEKLGDEQQARLLGEEDYLADDDGDLPVRLGAESEEPEFLWRGSLLAVLLMLLSVAAVVALAFLTRSLLYRDTRTQRHQGQGQVPQAQAEDFRRPGSDYILDPDWDYGAAPQVREYDWVIRDIVANPDGVFRPMIAINGRFPGEMIRCNEGDTVVVNVDNQSVNATAIHWHGLFQNGSNWMDGTPGVTQCPIAPGRKFRYQFTVSGQSGTYFYHGHQGAQAHDGLAGPIIVHARDERATHPVAYASDRVVLLQDWYYDLGSELLLQKLSPGSSSSPIPNGALINGANVVNCALHPERACDTSSGGGGASLATLDVERGQAHRLRIVNAGAFAWFEVSVDGHLQLPTTEVDGTTVQPHRDDSVLISPGQRYSVVLTADHTDTTDTDTDTDAFWFRARMLTHCFSEDRVSEHGFAEARAILRYIASNTTTTTTTTTNTLPTTENDSGKFALECKDLPAGTYKPIPAIRAPLRAHRSWHVLASLQIDERYRLERGFLNGSTFRPQLRSPSLHRVVDGLAARNASFFQLPGRTDTKTETEDEGDGGEGEEVWAGINERAFDTAHELVVSNSNSAVGGGGIEVVDIVVQNADPGNHPFHLHGHAFFVLASGPGTFPGYESLGLAPPPPPPPPSGSSSETTPSVSGSSTTATDKYYDDDDDDENKIIENPLRRDVAAVEGGGWLLLRFVADNPGLWLFHCHMIWHAEMGMAMQFVSRADVLRGWTVPEQSAALCESGIEELRKGAAPEDRIFY